MCLNDTQVAVRFLIAYCVMVTLTTCKEDAFQSPCSDHYCNVEDISSTQEIIGTAILGTWEWTCISCVGRVGPLPNHTGLTMQISPDSTVQLFMDNDLFQTSTWTIEAATSERFQFQVQPDIEQLDGYILACSDKLVMQNSHIDLCDNFFRKIE